MWGRERESETEEGYREGNVETRRTLLRSLFLKKNDTSKQV